jgi:hypothetical protein
MRLTQKVSDTAFSSEKKPRTTRSIPKQEESVLVTDFLTMMDRWHGHKEIIDNELEILILQKELEIRTTNKKQLEWGPKGTKYFAPSSANSDARELFLKLLGHQRDEQPTPPHQGRWRRIGTKWGEVIQTDLLYIEKHYKKEFGENPPFKPEYVEINGKFYPAWEKFAQKIVWVEHRGHKIPILGQPDGILRHLPTGKRVGLEIKSKQTTPAQTSYFSMKGPKEDHVKQCINYSIMYGTPEAPLDDFLITYGNLAKKSWDMTPEEYEKNPDFRAFHVRVTEADRIALLDFYADVLDAIDSGIPPKLDLEKWAFNNFKTACALSLSDEEYEDIKREVQAVLKSSLPDWKKRGYIEALEFIKEVRSKGARE